uniref:Uncharacterized protein n=1 Tax=Talaromyces marneffei PM1 TaxID=1077442 RepID=A0A093UUZ0_TALMA
MNLEQFLTYIQGGAYEVAKQLLQFELQNEDRKQLRLVSRAINLVVLEHPILTTLLVHCVGEVRGKFIMGVWKSQAISQRKNIESSRDAALLTKIIPALKSVRSIIFAAHFYHSTRESPSSRTYKNSVPPEACLPIAAYWLKIGEAYLPDPEPDMDEEIQAEISSGIHKRDPRTKLKGITSGCIGRTGAVPDRDQVRGQDVFNVAAVSGGGTRFVLQQWRTSSFDTRNDRTATTTCKAVEACKPLQSLELFELCLEDERWEDVLSLWKQSGDLNGLDRIWLAGVLCTYQTNGSLKSKRSYQPRSGSAIADWLNGKASEFPLESFGSEDDD